MNVPRIQAYIRTLFILWLIFAAAVVVLFA